MRTVSAQNNALLEKERLRLQHQREMELLRRKEAHKNLLSMLNIVDWQEMLRDTSPPRRKYSN
jgi:hypothetical protein